MSVSLNVVNVAGNLTNDPQVRSFSNDKAVASFDIAINRKYKSSDGETKEETTYVSIEAWGRQAELCGQYLSKGRNVLVEGSLKLETWVDKEGKNRSKIKISAQRVHFIGSAQENATKPATASSNSEVPVDDEAPF